MSDIRRTRFNSELSARQIDLTTAVTQHQLKEAIAVADSIGCEISRTADPTADTFVLAPAASQTNTITVKAAGPGPAAVITTVEIADNGSDALSVTFTAGAVKINLANSTDASNTLTLIAAALHGLNTSTNGAVLSAFITGTASTQMVHGGTNTVAATAAGGTAAGGLKSSTAGVTGKFVVIPS